MFFREFTRISHSQSNFFQTTETVNFFINKIRNRNIIGDPFHYLLFIHLYNNILIIIDFQTYYYYQRFINNNVSTATIHRGLPILAMCASATYYAQMLNNKRRLVVVSMSGQRRYRIPPPR